LEWHCEWKNGTIDVYFGPYKKGKYKLLEEPYCHKCAHPGVTTEECTWHHSLYGFNRIYAMGKYYPSVKRAKDDLLSYHIWAFKKWMRYSLPLGDALSLLVKNRYPELLNSEVIVPVPLHPDRIHKRGYNQSLELAKVMGNKLNIKVIDALVKFEDVEMRPLNWKQRREVVDGLYGIREELEQYIRNKVILLLDDVVTTGFTVSECAQVLISSNAKEVNVLAAGRSVL